MTGPDTAGVAISSSAFVTSSCVVVGGRTVVGRFTRSPLVQSRSRVCRAPARSSSCPSTGGTGTGVTPSKRTVPSAGGLFTTGASCCRAVSRASSSTTVATPTSRVVKNDRTRVIGFSGCEPARSIVPGQSTVRPAVFGSISLVTSPTATATGSVVRGSTAERTRCSASAWLSPPICCPATVTPRGTLPELLTRSTA